MSAARALFVALAGASMGCELIVDAGTRTLAAEAGTVEEAGSEHADARAPEAGGSPGDPPPEPTESTDAGTSKPPDATTDRGMPTDPPQDAGATTCATCTHDITSCDESCVSTLMTCNASCAGNQGCLMKCMKDAMSCGVACATSCQACVKAASCTGPTAPMCGPPNPMGMQ